MATTVGTESTYRDLVTNLLYLEHDAIAAYDQTISRLDSPEAKRKISEFRGDHTRHLDELRMMARQLGMDAPMEGDAKQMLTTGKVALASIAGDGMILKAMKTNEDDTVTAYERASTHADANAASRAVFERAASDERRHRAWMETAAQAA